MFILDTALLDRLAAAKLEKVGRKVSRESWKWVEAQPAFDYEARSAFERRYPEEVPLSEEEAAELESLESEAGEGDVDNSATIDVGDCTERAF